MPPVDPVKPDVGTPRRRWENTTAVIRQGEYDRLRAIEAAARRYVGATAACRAGAEGAISEKGAAVAFEEGYDPLEAALDEFGAAEAALRAALSSTEPSREGEK